MTSLREAVRRRLQHERPAPPDPAFSYRVHWTAMARLWDADRRSRVLAALRARAASADFRPTEWERAFIVPELDDQAHAGSSLLILIEVLQALLQEPAQSEASEGDPIA